MAESTSTGQLPTDSEVAARVQEVVADALDLEPDDVRLDATLAELGAESLDLLDISFRLEKTYHVQYPGTGLLERAGRYFEQDALTQGGVVTDLGLHLLAIGMPELDAASLRPGLRDDDVARMIQVGSFVRITQRLLQAKADYPRVCPACGGPLVDSEVTPEFVCSTCGKIVPMPSGDDVLLADLIALYEANRPSADVGEPAHEDRQE